MIGKTCLFWIIHNNLRLCRLVNLVVRRLSFVTGRSLLVVCHLLFIFFPLLVSCEPNIENLDLPVQEKYTILECYLTPGYPLELTLTESNTLDDELIIHNLWYADVTVGTEEKTYPMKNILYSKPDRRILINYRSDDTLQSGMYQRFDLSVTTRQQGNLQASTGVVAPIRITDCKVTDNRINIHYEVKSGKADYLKVGVVLFMEKTREPIIQYFDISGQSVQSIALARKRPGGPVDSMAVTLFNIQKDYYDYGVSVQNAVSAYHDPLLTPETIKSNITGGVGIFTYYTFDQVKVYEW